MPIPPAQNPPVIVQPQSPQQSQQQEQQQNQFINPSINSSNSNNAGANSETTSTGNLNQQGELSNTQINTDSSSSVYGFSSGVYAPVPSVSVTTYSHSGSSGIAATLHIPLAGKVGKQHERLINNRIDRVVLDNSIVALQGELELATACAKIIVSGVVIDYARFPMLARCRYITTTKVQSPPIQIQSPPIQIQSPPIQIQSPPIQIQSPPPIQPPRQKEPLNPTPVRGLW